MYPVNRQAIVLPGENSLQHSTPTAVLARKKGIRYMPFYCPSVQFSEEEERQYERHYEEGFDVTNDDRYNYWMKLNHPESAPPESVCTQLFVDADSSPTSPSNVSVGESHESPLPSPLTTNDASFPPKTHSKLSEFLPPPVPLQKKTRKEPTGVCLCTYYIS